jgi:hypothetical protein
MPKDDAGAEATAGAVRISMLTIAVMQRNRGKGEDGDIIQRES